MKLYGLYQKIDNAVTYLSAFSDSLLLNLTILQNHLIRLSAKKSVENALILERGSYNARIAGAVVQYNTKQIIKQIYQNMHKNVPTVVENLEKRREIKIAKTKVSREMDGK